MTQQLDNLLAQLRHSDAACSDDVFPPPRRAAILAAIMADEPAVARARRRPRRVALPALGALLVCALAAGLATLLHSAPPVHAAPVSFRYPARGAEKGYIIATVTDPFAAQSSLDAAFRAAGLDIAVSLVPASPSAVGTVVEISEPSSGPQIEALTGGACVTGGGGPGNCPIGLKIPRDFTGAGAVVLGRPARSGEEYESTNSAFAPGESLHCSGLIGKTVAEASSVLAARGITVEWQTLTSGNPQSGTAPVVTSTTSTTETGTGTTTAGAASSGGAQVATGSPRSGYYVVDGTPIRAGVVMLATQPDPLLPQALGQDARMYGSGC